MTADRASYAREVVLPNATEVLPKAERASYAREVVLQAEERFIRITALFTRIATTVGGSQPRRRITWVPLQAKKSGSTRINAQFTRTATTVGGS